ncbi:MAG: energy-coupling factor transporter ATPase [Candidatus Latescibacterota bacterium]
MDIVKKNFANNPMLPYIFYMINISHLTFSYCTPLELRTGGDPAPGQLPILNDLSLVFETGVHTAIMGPNGSGKSTLALLLKGLLLPSGGVISVDGFSASSGEKERLEVMKRVGLVFQNPDNTIVSTTVERELAFGLENLGIPGTEMRPRVDETLSLFELEEYRHNNPSHLSGGEKQRLALACVMIMKPEYLILDEPTSLLDPGNRSHIIDLIREQAKSGTTVIHITQFASEALHADRVIILTKTGVARDGSPSLVLRDTDALGIRGIGNSEPGAAKFHTQPIKKTEPSPEIIRLENISYWYDRGLPFEKKALENIYLTLHKGTSTVLLGPAGSGKTTLLEIACGLTHPSAGQVHIGEKPLRAMAFQFPEDQMFGDTVGEYVSFGPGNIGMTGEAIKKASDRALFAVGLDPALYSSRDPLTLSGGEKRRAALAGVLAMRPDVLILDEPTAGLDLRGTNLILNFLEMYLDDGGTLLFSTHDFEVAERSAEYAVVLEQGRLETCGELKEVFADSRWIEKVRNKHSAHT